MLWDRYDDESVLGEIDRMNNRGLAPYSSKPGFPANTAVLEQYEEATGASIDHRLLPVYRAHAAFMLGTVWADLHRFAVEAGEDSDREPYVDYAALLAECFLSAEDR